MKDLIIDMWSDGWLGKTLFLFLVFVLALIPIGIYATIEEAKQWEEFKLTHRCKIVAHEK